MDLFGHQIAQRPFKDIRNQRPSTAERKAMLLPELGELLKRPPQEVLNGSVNKVRAWMDRQERAAKVAKSARSSITEIEIAIKSTRMDEEKS